MHAGLASRFRFSKASSQATASRSTPLGGQRIAVLGLSFKPSTDDVRESPTIQLVRELWEEGFDVTVHDPDIRLDEMLGANRAFLERQLPQIAEIAKSSVAQALDGADVVVVSQRRREFTEAVRRLEPKKVLDLVSLDSLPASDDAVYRGISW
jgi:GDP-mannose 6-dehydrogenase